MLIIQLLSVKLPMLVGKKRRNVLTNKSSTFSKTIEANNKGEERKFPNCNVVKFFFNGYASNMFL